VADTDSVEGASVIAGHFGFAAPARGRVAGADGKFARRANLCGASVLVAGVLTLGLNLLGI
jgi:hypothetical protein